MGNSPAQFKDLEDVFKNLVSSLLAFGGVVLFLMLLSGGFKYLSAGGDPKALDSAKKTLTYAIAGLVLLAGSYLILQIIGEFTGVQTTITDFKIFKQ